MELQLLVVDVAVVGAFSLHGVIYDDKLVLRHHQVSEQRQHTECGGNSLLFCENIRGTMLWKMFLHCVTKVGANHLHLDAVVDSYDTREIQNQRGS